MLIDCDTCPGRGRACSGCAVGAVLDAPAAGIPLDDVERRAVDTLVASGLLPVERVGALRAVVEPWARARAVG